ncbi:phospholipase A2 [Streptomyces flaveus]
MRQLRPVADFSIFLRASRSRSRRLNSVVPQGVWRDLEGASRTLLRSGTPASRPRLSPGRVFRHPLHAVALGHSWVERDETFPCPDLPSCSPFSVPCARHDFGYRNYKAAGTFSADKSRLDSAFYVDLKRVCANYGGGTVLS